MPASIPTPPSIPPFDTDAFVGLRAFLNAIADRTGPIKVSLTGPVTLGVALQAAGVDRELAFRISGRAVRARGRALVDLVLQRVPQAQVVAFVDEPALVGLTEKGFPVGPNDGVDLVSGALASLEPLAVTGLHCCGAADWRLALASGPRILSAPGGRRRRAPCRARRRLPRLGGLVGLGGGARRRPGRPDRRSSVAPAHRGVRLAGRRRV